MSRDPAAVEHHLRQLGGEDLAAFVADLWAARGFETHREDGVVVATRDGRTRRLAVRGLAPDPPDGPVDAVIAPDARAAGARGTRSGTTSEPHGVRVVDATALREMLWYAVDPETTAALCERHLGAPPDRLAAPLGTRLRRRLRAPPVPVPGVRRSGADAGPRAVPSPGARVSAVLVVLVVLALVGVVAGAGVLDDGRARGDGTPTPGPTPAAVPTDAGTPNVGAPIFPGLARVPGVDATGVTDPAALAAAHDRALGDRYALWIDISRPASEDSYAVVRHRDIDITVAGDRYLLEDTLVRNDDENPLLTVYDDGRRLYVSDYRRLPLERRALPPNASWPAIVPPPDVFRRTLVTRYLTSPETNVSGVVEEDGREYYRIVATGAPEGELGNVTDYTAVALVDDRGLVVDLEAQYVRRTAEGRVPIRFEATYGPNRGVVFTPPEWYETVAGNRTTDTSERAEQ